MKINGIVKYSVYNNGLVLASEFKDASAIVEAMVFYRKMATDLKPTLKANEGIVYCVEMYKDGYLAEMRFYINGILPMDAINEVKNGKSFNGYTEFSVGVIKNG